MPNNFAYFMLLVWPIVTIVLYKNHPVITATFWTIVGGYLLLPVGVEFDFPLIPPLDKKSIPAIMAFIGCRYIANQKVRLLPPPGIERNLILILFLGSVATVLTNGDPVIEPNRYIPGLSFHDTLSTVISQWLMLIPFILGMQIIRTHKDQVRLLRLLVIAGICYSILIIFEIRMSPQLHTWIYGFFPHSWSQQLRYGGYRPVVFLGHGLWVSIFIFMALGSIVSLSKLKLRSFRLPDNIIVIYFILLLILAKGVGSILLGLGLILAMVLLKKTLISKASILIAFAAILYPLLCIADLFPHQYILEIINSLDPSRAESLGYRFSQETSLLERATQKILFGWGGWGRNRLEESVTDGYWIILVGKYGLIGFAAIFGLMFTSVLRTAKTCLSSTNKIQSQYIAGISLTLAFLMIDQIPNASINPIIWILMTLQFGSAERFISNNQKHTHTNA
tara:strand:+ start:746 stop:2095 length:1350 start_codon:yes stop_codon:yes gene_type:complete